MATNNPNDENICEEMVTRIAQLAKLRLTPEEASHYQSNFSELLALFHELDSLDISQNVSTDLVLRNASECREDIPATIDNSALSEASPFYNEQSSYFDVPQFIEYDDE
jgi:aspartyl/glutamyl-tRNA(Asn/Gln) amidotransferase C subunit